MFKLFFREIDDWFSWALSSLPGRVGRLIRRFFFKLRLSRSGCALSVCENVEISCPNNISFGNNISLVSGVVLRACDRAKLSIGNHFHANGNVRIIADCGGKIEIGNHVMIGPNTVIRSSNHRYDCFDTPMDEQGHEDGFITIGDDVWIGANVVILSNVKVGSHSIVGAGAVVTHDVPEYSIVGGVPAKVIGIRQQLSKQY